MCAWIKGTYCMFYPITQWIVKILYRIPKWSLHVPAVFVQVFLGCFGYVPFSKDMHVRLISKLSVGLNVGEDACMSLCVVPSNWVQPHLYPQIIQIVGPACLPCSGQGRVMEDKWIKVYFSSDFSDWENVKGLIHIESCAGLNWSAFCRK